jgi:hypothetical protein
MLRRDMALNPPHMPRSLRPMAFGTAVAVTLATSGCGEGRPSVGRASRILSAEDLAAVKAEARAAMKEELREEVRTELKRELRPSVLAEIEREARALGTRQAPAPPADTANGNDGSSPVPVPETERPKSEVDLWTRPGTHIWPLGTTPKLTELYVGSGLDEKLPTQIQTHYPTPPEILYCYTVFENTSVNTTVTHVWRRGARLVSRVELEVGQSPKWRTWSKQRTQPHWVGTWSCEVLGPEGEQLGLTVFEIGG